MTPPVKLFGIASRQSGDVDEWRPSREDAERVLAQIVGRRARPCGRALRRRGRAQRQDVDLLRGVVNVRRALKDVNGRLELGTTKTHAQRTISLPTFLRNMLADHLAQATSGGTGPDAFVFTMKGGRPLRHGLVYGRYFRRAVRAALPAEKHGLRFHDLRHTCASLGIAAGAHPKLISARLGHSSITITLDRYGHLFPSVEEALAEALDAAFAAAGDATPSDVAELRP